MSNNNTLYENVRLLVKQFKKIALRVRNVITPDKIYTGNQIYPLSIGINYIDKATNFVTFPNPALYKGQKIIFYNDTNFSCAPFPNSLYIPFDPQALQPISVFQIKLLHVFYSTGTQWVGGIKYT